MRTSIFRKLITCARPSTVNKMSPKFYSIYEPDYLEIMKSEYPIYPPLTVQIRGYDFPILENYQKWLHKIAEAMNFQVDNSYIMPAKQMKVIKYKPKSTVIDAEFFLNIYERHIKISNVPAIRLPIYIRIIEAALPPGVMLDIDEYSKEKEKLRFVPDKQLLDLKAELEEMNK